jgi:hypothetical protein
MAKDSNGLEIGVGDEVEVQNSTGVYVGKVWEANWWGDGDGWQVGFTGRRGPHEWKERHDGGKIRVIKRAIRSHA